MAGAEALVLVADLSAQGDGELLDLARLGRDHGDY